MEDAIVFHSGVARSHDIFWLSVFTLVVIFVFSKQDSMIMIRILLLKPQSTFQGAFSVTKLTLHLRF